VASGASQLASGTQTLASGAQTLAGGAQTVATGAAAARDGAAQLRDGLGTLASGTAELRDGLSDGVEQIPASTPDLRALQADTIADPVKVSSDKVASAEDYGAGLAPFFAALSAWIGIYALFLIVKPISRRAVTALHSPIRVTLAGWLTPAMLGAVQMVGLMGILAITLGFTFNNPIGTLGVMIFASATFAAIILMLNVWLGSVGQFLGLVLMVLQLVTAGGTFPWQTLPAPLAALHHVLPLGYVVDAMRQLMYGGNLGRAGWDLVVLGIWLVGALLLAAIGVTRMTHRRTLRDLQPSLIG
jgi:putative membrane protein